jgi:hypothetical protein
MQHVNPETGNPVPELSNAESFYAGALGRIQRLMPVLGAALAVAAWVRFGWRPATWFACGCAIAYVNFRWLERVVRALADSMTEAGRRPSGTGVFLKFFGRYLLVAVAGYVIFGSSPASVYGLLAGLFLPVVAILCEAAYEAYVALARGL